MAKKAAVPARLPRWTYLSDLDPQGVGREAAENLDIHLTFLAREGGRDLAAAGDHQASRFGRLVTRIATYAQTGGGADDSEAEALVLRYCAILGARPRGAIPVHPTPYRAEDPLLMADLRTTARGPLPPDAFPDMAQVLLATKARIYLARGLPVAVRELAALASRPVNAMRRTVTGEAKRFLVKFPKVRRPAEQHGVRVTHELALAVLHTNNVPGFR